MNTPGGNCTGAGLAAGAVKNSPPACNRIAAHCPGKSRGSHSRGIFVPVPVDLAATARAELNRSVGRYGLTDRSACRGLGTLRDGMVPSLAPPKANDIAGLGNPIGETELPKADGAILRIAPNADRTIVRPQGRAWRHPFRPDSAATRSIGSDAGKGIAIRPDQIWG